MEKKALEQFADLMIRKIEQVSDNWEKPWFTSMSKGNPQNLTGRKYNGMNSLLLFVFSEKFKYKTPVYLTFKQAQENNVLVKKGEKALPVIYWNMTVKHKDTGRTIDIKDYNKLTLPEKQQYKVIPFLREYRVFNIEQTTFPEMQPERWNEIQAKFKAPEIKDATGMFASPEMDNLLKQKAWHCEIRTKNSDKAYYSPSLDYINVPLKTQFKAGEAFYSTLLHEMAHSTGHPNRLDRNIQNAFGSEKYAKEELVAELTSALTCRNLGISSGIREENAQYLKNWLAAIKEEPKFILSVLSDVNKANEMIEERINSLSEKVELSEKLYNEIKEKHSDAIVMIRDKDTFSIFKEDAIKIANELNYELKDGKITFPNDQLDSIIPEIIRAGYRVAMADIGQENTAKEETESEKKAEEKDTKEQKQAAEFTSAPLFQQNELPAKEFAMLGLDLNKIASDKIEQMMQGKKQTFDVIFPNVTTGQNMSLQASLSLQRNSDNSVSLMMNPTMNYNNEQSKTFSLKR